jgi:hypothetical protein
MHNYRLYPLDKGGHFLGVVEFIASGDTTAVEIAARTSEGQPYELWEQARLVKKSRPAAEEIGS